MGGCDLGPSEVTVVYGDGRLFVTIDGKQHRVDEVTLKVPKPQVEVGGVYDVAVQEVTIVADDAADDEKEETCEQALVLSKKQDDGTFEIAWVYSKKDLQSMGISHPNPVLSSHVAAVNESCFRNPAKDTLCPSKMLDHDTNRLRDSDWSKYADVAIFRNGGARPSWISPTAAACNVEVIRNPNGPKFDELDALLCAIRTASSRKRPR